MATLYGLDVWGPGIGEGDIFRARPDRPWSAPSLLYGRYRNSFPELKRPGRGVDYPRPTSAEVKESIKLYLCSPSGPSWPILGRTVPFLFFDFLDRFSYKFPVSKFMTIRPVGYEFIHADRRTERHDEANTRSSRLVRTCIKPSHM